MFEFTRFKYERIKRLIAAEEDVLSSACFINYLEDLDDDIQAELDKKLLSKPEVSDLEHLQADVKSARRALHLKVRDLLTNGLM